MNKRNISRRDLLKWSLGIGASSAIIESLGHMVSFPGWHPLLGGSSLPHPHWAVKDSFALTHQLGRQGALGQLSTLFQLQQAVAQNSINDWSLITIKVFDQMHHPLVFALGRIDNNNVTSSNLSNTNHPATNKCSTNTANHLTSEGIKNLATSSRFRALRFNDWFAKRLENGTYNGKPLTDNAAQHFGYSDYLGAFPSNVAIQVGLGVQPIAGSYGVHRLGRGKLREELCDLSHMAALKGLIQSPLGITCMMSGSEYDSVSGTQVNVVFNGLNLQNKDNAEVMGRNLQSIVQNLSQSLNEGFGDDRQLENNLTYLFDRLSLKTPQRRVELLKSRANVKTALAAMKSLADKELQPLAYSTVNETESNKQALFSNGAYTIVPAKQEFVAQCAYVAKSLSITGTPYRNFSLFLNLNDLDGSDIDNPKNNNIAFRANSLNYVEGMRQLAMGLNILAKAIQGKNALVVLISDGGRNRDMTDGAGGAFTMLMGPKDRTSLVDALYANQSVFNSDDYNEKGVLQNLGSQETGLGWTIDSPNQTWGLFESSGRLATSGTQTNSGDWQLGVLDLLGSIQRKPVMSPEFGRFVRFKRS